MTQDRNSRRSVDPVRAVATELLGRPLTARSVIASLLLGTTPPELSGAVLVRWCGLFGIPEGTARVALSRMASGGELVATTGRYALAGPLTEKRRYQDWSLSPRLRRWNGDWDLRVVAAPRPNAADRQALRTAMERSRLAELREGTWMRPANLPPEAAPADAAGISEAQCLHMTARPDGDPVELAATLFHVDSWSERGSMLADRLEEVTARLDAGDLDRLAEGFVVGAAAQAHIRSDPLLPDPLLPDGFPGERLRRSYLHYLEVYAAATKAGLEFMKRHEVGVHEVTRSGTSELQ